MILILILRIKFIPVFKLISAFAFFYNLFSSDNTKGFLVNSYINCIQYLLKDWLIRFFTKLDLQRSLCLDL